MESITKNRQSPATLRALTARAYGDGLVPAGDGWVQELGHGWFNVVYLIRLVDGRSVVLKIAPPPHIEVMSYEKEAMATELAALQLIRDKTEVPVPTVDFADRSHELCDADYFFMSYVDADNFGILRQEGRLSPEHENAYREAVGALNRELNEVRGPWFGALEGPGHSTWRACFTDLLEGVLGDGERRDVDLGYGYDVVREAVAARAGTLDAVTEPRFVEWDLFPNNAMVRDGKIVSVIDHERAFYGDPLIEAGFVGLDLPGVFGDPAAFLRGYGWGDLTDDERQRRWLYSLYLVLIMIIETSYRGHTTTTQYDWCRERLVELMG
ncbi:aminoglycoside phosphotransferase family protein [Kineosporia mesophila]|uniref:Aminoglycoside phosphotransferase family protein n=1 Tax=Kineosporia mesophila TaxID=566012 RepID=A0ABP7AK11_9ACTN|nr:aminoglycoside phosphotransferase family protein [Kineosporia mesophila]